MNRITLWYAKLSRKGKIAIICTGVVIALAVSAVVAYMALVPRKVEVRYGTIVRDPIDGHVWEDNTKTVWVYPSEASNYRVEYIDQYSEEHAQQIAEKQAQRLEEQATLEESQGLEAMTYAVPQEQIQELETLQHNISVMGQDVLSGMEMANEISETKSLLVDYRNQAAVAPLPPELEHLRGEALQLFDLYITACDYYLQAIATADMSYVYEANNLIDQANQQLQNLVPSFQ